MYWKTCITFCFLASQAGIAIAQNCYESSIVSPSPFMGNNGEIFKLADGTIWEVKYDYEYLYVYLPTVIICPSKGKLSIDGKLLNIAPVGNARPVPQGGPKGSSQSAGVIESHIAGEFSGWDGETIFKLTNGQIWQQSSYAYTYTYKYRPRILIFPSVGGFELQVEGMNQRISVIRLK